MSFQKILPIESYLSDHFLPIAREGYESRFLYATRKFMQFYDDPELGIWQNHSSIPDGRLQIDNLLDLFASGGTITELHCKLLREKTDRVYALRTADIRIFGFFANQSSFVCVCGNTKKNLRKLDKNAKNDVYLPYINEVKLTYMQMSKSVPDFRPTLYGGSDDC